MATITDAAVRAELLEIHSKWKQIFQDGSEILTKKYEDHNCFVNTINQTLTVLDIMDISDELLKEMKSGFIFTVLLGLCERYNQTFKEKAEKVLRKWRLTPTERQEALDAATFPSIHAIISDTISDKVEVLKNFGAMVDKLEETHKTKIDQLMDESINKTTRLAELSTRLHEQEAKIEKLGNDAEHEYRTYVDFDRKLRKAFNTEIADLKKQLETTGTKLQNALHNVDNLNKKVDEDNKRIDDLDNKVGEQEEEITDLKDQLQKERECVVALEEELEEDNTRIEDLDDKVGKQEEEISILKEQVETIKAMKADLTKATREKKIAVRDKATLNTQVQQKDEEIAQINAIVTEHTRQLQEDAERQRELVEEKATLNTQVQQKDEEIAQINAVVTEHTRQLQEGAERQRELEEEKATLNSDVTEYKRKNNLKSLRIEKLETENERSKGSIGTLANMLHQTEEKVREKERLIEELEDRFSVLRDPARAARLSIGALRADRRNNDD